MKKKLREADKKDILDSKVYAYSWQSTDPKRKSEKSLV